MDKCSPTKHGRDKAMGLSKRRNMCDLRKRRPRLDWLNDKKNKTDANNPLDALDNIKKKIKIYPLLHSQHIAHLSRSELVNDLRDTLLYIIQWI